MLYLSDDDTSSIGLAFLQSKSGFARKIIIDQPTFRHGIQLFKQNIVVLSNMKNVTYVEICASNMTTIGWVGKLPHLRSLSIAHCPELAVWTLVLCTRTMSSLLHFHLLGLNHITETEVKELAHIRTDWLQTLEVSIPLSAQVVTKIFGVCTVLQKVDFVPKPDLCASAWRSVWENTQIEFGPHATKAFACRK